MREKFEQKERNMSRVDVYFSPFFSLFLHVECLANDACRTSIDILNHDFLNFCLSFCNIHVPLLPFSNFNQMRIYVKKHCEQKRKRLFRNGRKDVVPFQEWLPFFPIFSPQKNSPRKLLPASILHVTRPRVELWVEILSRLKEKGDEMRTWGCEKPTARWHVCRDPLLFTEF